MLRSWLIRATSVLAGLALAASDDGGKPTPALGPDPPEALALTDRATPRMPLRRYDTRGRHPQVAGDLDAVNAALTEAFRVHQRAFIRANGSLDRDLPPDFPYRGHYETRVDTTLISASRTVVSAIVPVLSLRPGGNGGSTWVTRTVRVPSGEPVGVRSLFADPGAGLRVLAKATRANLLERHDRVGDCIRKTASPDPSWLREGTAPTTENFRRFGLMSYGFVVAITQSQVANPPCSRMLVTIPYELLRPHLSPLARELVGGVRAPRRPADCTTSTFDAQRWRARGTRTAAAEQLVRCRALEGMTRPEVERLLGRPAKTRPDHLEYELRTERAEHETTTTVLSIELLGDRVARYSVHPR